VILVSLNKTKMHPNYFQGQGMLSSILQSHAAVRFVIRLEARLQYWTYFTARFGGVHAFDYNSAVSEPIWMKSGAL